MSANPPYFRCETISTVSERGCTMSELDTGSHDDMVCACPNVCDKMHPRLIKFELGHLVTRFKCNIEMPPMKYKKGDVLYRRTRKMVSVQDERRSMHMLGWNESIEFVEVIHKGIMSIPWVISRRRHVVAVSRRDSYVSPGIRSSTLPAPLGGDISQWNVVRGGYALRERSMFPCVYTSEHI